jgi:hypothetical protein
VPFGPLGLPLGCWAVLIQVSALQFWRTGIVPTRDDRAAGEAMIARLADLPSPTLVPSHPYYARLAGHQPMASTIAIVDLLATQRSRARDSLLAQLPISLVGIQAIVVDNDATDALFGEALRRDFSIVESDLVPGVSFLPVGDVPVKPRIVHLRTTELPR